MPKSCQRQWKKSVIDRLFCFKLTHDINWKRASLPMKTRNATINHTCEITPRSYLQQAVTMTAFSPRLSCFVWLSKIKEKGVFLKQIRNKAFKLTFYITCRKDCLCFLTTGSMTLTLGRFSFNRHYTFFAKPFQYGLPQCLIFPPARQKFWLMMLVELMMYA